MSLDTLRPIWEQGMFLNPQHFQQQNRFLTQELQRVSGLLKPNLWGISHLSYKHSGGDSPYLKILQVEGSFINGVAFSFNPGETNAETLKIKPEDQGKTLFCCLPKTSQNTIEPTEGSDSGQVFTHKRRVIKCYDENTGAVDSEDITVAEPNISFKIAESISNSHYLSIPLLRISSLQEKDVFQPEQHLIRPAPVISGCVGYSLFLNSLKGLMTIRAGQLSRGLQGKKPTGGNSVVEFLYLQFLNKMEAFISEILGDSYIHPQELFLQLKTYAFELCTYVSPDKRPPDNFPVYNHSEPQLCFAPLWELLKSGLESVPEKEARKLGMETHEFGVRSIRLSDKSILQASRFILAVRSPRKAEDVVSLVPRNIKLAPVEKIGHIVNSLLEGIPIQHLSTSPQELPHLPDFHFFELNKGVDLWHSLAQSKALALHTTHELVESQLEIWAIFQE